MADARSAWLPPTADPQRRSLLRWALLPSMTLHPDRHADLPAGAAAWLARLPPGSAACRRLHRHWSAQLARTLAPLEESAAPDDSVPSLALLSPEAWARLQRVAGAGLTAGHLRRVIAREPVALLRDQLGEAGYAWALAQPDECFQPPPLPAAELLPACERRGAALLWRAFDAVPPAWAQRLRLRLAPAAAQDAEAAPVDRHTPEQALQTLALLLHRLNPA